MSRSATTTAPQEAASGAPAQDWEIKVDQSTTPFVPQGSVIRIKDKDGLKELTVDEGTTVKWGPHKFEFDPAAGRGKAHRKEKDKDKVIQLLELFVIPSPNVPGEISGISGAFLTFPPASLAATEDPETLGVWGSETRTPPPREEEPHGRKR
ncbi:MAG TPA: hypothetical protein VHC97_11830 [Thermoanaerobaculia bacterium]|jgi:hypothetical protein|nr:hypothetical protein [Thermoanaerobaculia bacterium]